jgi:4-aminobutyrate--pyruvate transaminase
MAPPLIINAAQVDVILAAVAESLDEVYAGMQQ